MAPSQPQPTTQAKTNPQMGGGRELAAAWAMSVPIGFALALAAYGLSRPEIELTRSMLGASAFLLVWAAVLGASAHRAGRRLTLDVIARRPHYVQLTAQFVLAGYWAYYVPAIRVFVVPIIGQLLFAYAFSALLAWSRRDRFELGFGPVPIIMSISFFMIFRPEWFHWQFGVVGLGYLAKEFIRWEKGNRRTHIFNPSSFPLAVFSLFLIVSGTSDVTFGRELATTLFTPPNIHWVIFLVALPAQFLFGVATMTMAAVLTTYAFSLAFFAATGTYFFYDAHLPIAVFLGMHLLFTDPSTSPRSESGRVVYGVLYALGAIALYSVLLQNRIPTFYDKLLPVPILNMLIQLFDRTTASGALAKLDAARWLPELSTGRRYLLTGSVWVLAFLGLVAAKGVGDDHPGQYLPFWDAQCEAGSQRACDYAPIVERDFCEKGSGWACNELGIRFAQREADPESAFAAIERGCQLNFATACENARRLASGQGQLLRTSPELSDWPIVVRGSKGPVTERDPVALRALACERGWPGTCGSRFVGG